MNWYKISQQEQYKTHVIKKGETLSSIAAMYYKDANKWKYILESNPQIKDPKNLKIGEIIKIPEISLNNKEVATDVSVEKKTPKTDIVEDYVIYVVQKGDNLSSIAKKMLGEEKRWTEIQKINDMKDTNISIGQKIKLPKVNNLSVSEKDVPNKKVSKENAVKYLKKLIAKNEGGYGSYNRGKAGDTPNPTIDITKLTIGDIIVRQTKSNRDFFAVGKYQFTPNTLQEAIAYPEIGVKKTDLFSPDNQEKLFMYLLYKRKNLMRYLSGKSDDINAAVNDLAREFASLPNTSGVGMYDNTAGNEAKGGISKVNEIKNILKSIRDSGVFRK